MAFWGVYLKPNEPYILHYDNDAAPNRLRITQATLGDATRNSPARSIVRCSVGAKPAIAICSLSVKELTCCQLELEFEESHDVVFSVVGPRGVYLAGYLIAPAPAAHQLLIDHDFCKDDLDAQKTGPVKESIDAQNTHTEPSDKNIKGGKRLLKCSRDININGKIVALDKKPGKDGIEGYNEDKEKTMAVKPHSVFGRLLEKKRHATTNKMKQSRKRSRKQSDSEATASEHVDDLWSCGANEGNKENPKRKKKSKDCSRKKGKFVFMKMIGLRINQ